MRSLDNGEMELVDILGKEISRRVSPKRVSLRLPAKNQDLIYGSLIRMASSSHVHITLKTKMRKNSLL